VAKRRRPKTPPEEWARQEANTRRLYELAECGVARLGMTRGELFRKLGWPDADARR
jgi:hypothetical protein